MNFALLLPAIASGYADLSEEIAQSLTIEYYKEEGSGLTAIWKNLSL